MEPGKHSIILPAPAKINLFLHVVGKRVDGYHDLHTWMVKVGLYDVLTLELFAGEGVQFYCTHPEVPNDDSNIVVRAAKIFFAKSKMAQGVGVKIFLQKNIPVAAGLGGGSSDAGIVLRGLNDYFDKEFSENELIESAAALGADVPFFTLHHPSVLAEGIGDLMIPAGFIVNCTFILVNPGIFVSTASVFKNFALTRTEKNSRLSCFQKYEADHLSLDLMHNDLEQVTCARYPVIDRIKNALLIAGASKVLMSGSGPTVFGVFPDNSGPGVHDFKRLVSRLRREYGEKVFLCRAITGASPSGKAPGFDPGIRRFESCRPSQ